jgi:histidine ammonia-lyase
VFDDPPEVISAGNFHGQSLALAFDTLRIALADLASISERRIFRLVSPSLSEGLPAFLSREPGPSSGYMIAQYAAAALVAELRTLSRRGCDGPRRRGARGTRAGDRCVPSGCRR